MTQNKRRVVWVGLTVLVFVFYVGGLITSLFVLTREMSNGFLWGSLFGISLASVLSLLGKLAKRWEISLDEPTTKESTDPTS